MHHLSIDLETYSSVPIAKAGAQKYISSPDFEILLFAYSLDGAPVEIVDLATGEQLPPWLVNSLCTSQQILDTNHKKIYNKKLSVSQISVRNATCDIELASDSLTNKLDAVH